MIPDVPVDYPTEYFEEIDGSEDGEYLAFMFDHDDEPVGTLTGVHLTLMIKHLKMRSNRKQERYVLVQVLESYQGETIH